MTKVLNLHNVELHPNTDEYEFQRVVFIEKLTTSFLDPSFTDYVMLNES